MKFTGKMSRIEAPLLDDCLSSLSSQLNNQDVCATIYCREKLEITSFPKAMN